MYKFSRGSFSFLIAMSIGLPFAHGMGFHGGGGGGFHGGGFGGGGGFHGGGMGGFGGRDFGGYGGGGGFSGGYDHASFDHAGAPSFGNYGLSGYGGYGARGAYGLGGYGAGRGAEGLSGLRDGAGRAPQSIENRFAGQGGLDGEGFGRNGAGVRPNLPVTNSELQGFLGLRGPGPGERAPGAGSSAWPAGHAGNRPAWQNLSPDALNNIHSQIARGTGPERIGASKGQSWLENHPERAKQLNDWGNDVRRNWSGRDVRPGSDWWSKYHPNLDHWYYHHDWHNHDWNYWWGYSPWTVISPWFAPWGWSEPIYYDYGDGGNVVYENNNVYVNGQDVGTAEQYAQSAAELATVPPSEEDSTQEDGAQQDTAQSDQWLPLGTFAVVTSRSDANPTRILQLAVDKQGIVSGTLHNGSTKKDYVVQGRVDKQTQRLAITFGSNSDVVLETGIYNLTQPQTHVLVHYGPDKTEQLMLVRLDAPKEQDGAQTSGLPADNPLGGAPSATE